MKSSRMTELLAMLFLASVLIDVWEWLAGRWDDGEDWPVLDHEPEPVDSGTTA